jgi:hypothetical protein
MSAQTVSRRQPDITVSARRVSDLYPRRNVRFVAKSPSNNLRAESRTRYLNGRPEATKPLYHNWSAHLVNEQVACKRLVDDPTRLAILRRMALPRKMGSSRRTGNPLRGRGLRCSSSCHGSRQPSLVLHVEAPRPSYHRLRS